MFSPPPFSHQGSFDEILARARVLAPRASSRARPRARTATFTVASVVARIVVVRAPFARRRVPRTFAHSSFTHSLTHSFARVSVETPRRDATRRAMTTTDARDAS
jgi:hypothetical protein